MNAPERLHTAVSPKFVWDDPLLLEEQLTEEERMVRDAARAYAQEKLAPRVLEAFRHEKSDPAIFPEMGALGLLGASIRATGRCSRCRARSSCSRSTRTARRSSGANICRSSRPASGSAASG